MKITLDLTEQEAQILVDILIFHWDEGPVDSGWQSNELSNLSSKICLSVGQAKDQHKDN